MKTSANILTEDFPDPVMPMILCLGECQLSSRNPSTYMKMASGRFCIRVVVPLLTLEVPGRAIGRAIEVGAGRVDKRVTSYNRAYHTYIQSAANMCSDGTSNARLVRASVLLQLVRDGDCRRSPEAAHPHTNPLTAALQCPFMVADLVSRTAARAPRKTSRLRNA